MQDRSDEADFVFLSYSHDSEIHKERVRALAERLITSGVPTELDQYKPFPPEGWPSWMVRRVAAARFVLVICTEVYYTRAMGLEEPGVGSGAAWESQIITQELYDNQGQNKKFIPVVLDEEGGCFVPSFLKAFTIFNLASTDGFINLLRLITDQPAYVPPPLGDIVTLPPATTGPPSVRGRCRMDSSGDMVLLHLLDDGMFWLDSDEITESDSRIHFSLLLESDAAATEARRLSKGNALALAYDNTAFNSDIENVELVRKNREHRLILDVRRSTSDYGAFMEASLNELSADKIAEMRARRILLDETLPPAAKGDVGGELNAATLEVFVRGVSSPIKVLRSPIPLLYYTPDMPYEQRQAFLATARLLAILFLRLSGAIDIIDHISLDLDEDSILGVSFAGWRPKKYANVEPQRIVISGSFNLLDAKKRKVSDD